MVKALLKAPPCKVKNGFAMKLTPGRFTSLAYAFGSNVNLATEAGDHMERASTFLQASCQLGEVNIEKFLADLEGRFVMHVVNIQLTLRKSFPDLIAIVPKQLWSDVKAPDRQLSGCIDVRSVGCHPSNRAGASPLPPPGRIKLLPEEGKISNSELHECRFILGALVTDQSGDPYDIVSLDDELSVSLEKQPKGNAEDNAEEKDSKGKANAEHKKEKKDNETHHDDNEKNKDVKVVTRVALMRAWKVYKEPEVRGRHHCVLPPFGFEHAVE